MSLKEVINISVSASKQIPTGSYHVGYVWVTIAGIGSYIDMGEHT